MIGYWFPKHIFVFTKLPTTARTGNNVGANKR